MGGFHNEYYINAFSKGNKKPTHDCDQEFEFSIHKPILQIPQQRLDFLFIKGMGSNWICNEISASMFKII